MSTFTRVKDSKVCNYWECEKQSCHMEDEDIATAMVHPDFYQESGTPICGICGDDMNYLYTEILNFDRG